MLNICSYRGTNTFSTENLDKQKNQNQNNKGTKGELYPEVIIVNILVYIFRYI